MRQKILAKKRPIYRMEKKVEKSPLNFPLHLTFLHYFSNLEETF